MAQLASKMLQPFALDDIAGFMTWFSASDGSPWIEWPLNDTDDIEWPLNDTDDGEPDDGEPDGGEPDGDETDDGKPDEVDVKSVVSVIKHVLHDANLSIDSVITGVARDQTDAVVDKTAVAGFDGVLKENASIIYEISRELSCKCSGGDDVPSATKAIFRKLSKYSSDAKLVISLAALAVKYDAIAAELSTKTDPLTKLVSLKLSSNIIADANSLKSHIDPVNDLNNTIVKMIDCIVQLKEICGNYTFSWRTEKLIQSAFLKLSVAAYLTIGSIVTCSSQITSLLDMNNNKQITPSEPLELSTMAEFVTYIQDYLSLLHRQCQVEIEGMEPYKRFCDHMLEIMAHTEDNVTILKELICLKDGKQQPPLLGGSCQKWVGIEEVLKRKTVLLLISDLDIVKEELLALDKIYPETKTNSDLLYEIVWIPVVNSSTPLDEVSRKQFEEMQKIMPWYVVADPWLLDPASIRYMEEQWSYAGGMLLVVLDPQGKVVCKNALDMVMLWGNVAYPFTDAQEQSLWKEQTWKLEFLLNGIYPAIWEWISQGKAIWLYGGKDLEWARKFTALAKDCAKRFDITMEMLYVGHSEASEEVLDKIISAIKAGEVLGHYLPMDSIWYFWTRLERIKRLMYDHAQDKNIIKEVRELRYLDRYCMGWCVNNEGSTKMSITRGSEFLSFFTVLSFFTDAEPPPLISSTDYESLLENLRICKSSMLRFYFHAGEAVWENRRPIVLCEGCGRPKRKFIKHVCKLLTTQATQAESSAQATSADSTSATSATDSINN